MFLTVTPVKRFLEGAHRVENMFHECCTSFKLDMVILK